MKRILSVLLCLLLWPGTSVSTAQTPRASSVTAQPSSGHPESRLPAPIDGPVSGTPVRRDPSPPRFTLAYTHPEPTAQAAAFADVYGSGRPDIVIAAKAKVHVIRNEGHGRFSHGMTLSVDNANGWGAHDLNGDGRLDLFIAQQEERGSKDALLPRGDGTFVQTDLGNESLLPARSVLFADFDGDGYADAFHTGSAFSDNHNWNQLHRGLPGGRFGPNVIDEALDPPIAGFWHKTASGPGGCTGEWSNKQFKGAIVRDLDGDGKPDIVITAYADLGFADDRCLDYARSWVEAQERGVFVLQNVSTPGTIRFREAGNQAISRAHGATSSDMNAYHAVPLDFDRDGDFDLFVGATVRRDRATGGYEDTPAVRFLENVSTPGTIRFIDRTREVGLGWLNDLPPAERTKRNLAAGVPMDAGNEGFVDLVLANRDNAPDFATVHLFRNVAGRRFELVDPAVHGIGGGAGGRDVTAADLDADGCLDIVLSDGEAGGYIGADNARIYRNECITGNRWIALDVTDESGRTATGARVEVFDAESGERLGLDEVRTDFSYRSKRLPLLHFGLGTAVRVEVGVRLPDGRFERFPGLEANRVHRLVIPTVTFEIRTFDGRVTDASRSREIAYRLYWPEGATGALPVLLFSHGGDGNTTGHTVAPHLGTEWAKHGFLAIHLNHRPSATILQHERDRPADVSFVLDRLEAGNFPLPPNLSGTPDLSRVGHAGHSWGAYTSHAVGGAVFDQGQFRDRRIKAIAPISPQGPGGFGAFDRGPDDNSWKDVPVPAYTLAGSLEKDGSVGGGNTMPDWRLYPFNRYRVPPDRFLSVLPGQNHGDMVSGPPEVQEFVARNTRRFFEVYVAGRPGGACDIGFLAAIPGTDTRRKGDTSGLVAACPAGPAGFVPDDVRIGRTDMSYVDPEFLQEGALGVWADASGIVRVAPLDPRTGDFAAGAAEGFRIDGPLSVWSRYANGPEWGLDATGPALFYTKDDANGLGQVWRAEPPWDSPRLSPLTRDATLHNWLATASVNSTAASTRLVVYRGVPGAAGNVSAWLDEEAPESPVPFTDRTLLARWAHGSGLITYAQPGSGGAPPQAVLADTFAETTRPLTADAGGKIDPWLWEAPEFGFERLLAVNVDGSALGIYRDVARDGGPWQRIATIALPEGSPPLKSVEPVNGGRGAFGRSYFTAQSGRDDDPDTSIWLLGFDPEGRHLVRRLDEGAVSGRSGRRLDPESFAGEGELFVYYTLTGEGPAQLRRCRTGIRR